MPSLRTPEARACERCGREERWDDDAETWVIAGAEDELAVGNPHCIHEWDINGTFAPLER